MANSGRSSRPAPSDRGRPLCPDPGGSLPAVFVKSAIRQPILYRKRIARVDSFARAGDLVAVYDAEEKLAGYGLYNPKSEIALRMLRYEPELPDEVFWRGRFERAVSLRRDVLNLDETTDAYRVIHAESDGMSGLVVDRLGDVLSAEAFTPGMHQRAHEILARLAPLCGTTHTVLRTSPHSLSQEGFEADPIASPDAPDRVTIHEHGTRFRVGFAGGHKTGFFCDQRDNRLKLSRLCRDANVLDLCCYTAAFGLCAKVLGGAREVTSVDLDEAALAVAKENVNLNSARVNLVHSDAFIYLRQLIANGKRFDVVVCDPPKLARSREELDEALRKYYDLNGLSMQVVAPGGILLTCSCSGLVDRPTFRETVERAARPAKRTIQWLDWSGPGADHPVMPNCPESAYLKAAWVRVL